MKRLIEMMARLRSEGGCPWDREQTLETMEQFLVEECYEVIEAIESGDSEKHRDELGDLLLQVLFQSQIRKEEGKFDFDDVARGLEEKLTRRHPHVFGDETAETAGAVLKRWEEIKSSEKHREGRKSVLDGIPRGLPGLLKAQRIQARAARVGFDWTEIRDVVAKVEEELREVRQALEQGDHAGVKRELGDLLFAAVNLARFKGVSAEQALEAASRRFGSRFRQVEARVRAEGRKVSDCSLDELEAHWQAVKKADARQGEREGREAGSGAGKG